MRHPLKGTVLNTMDILNLVLTKIELRIGMLLTIQPKNLDLIFIVQISINLSHLNISTISKKNQNQKARSSPKDKKKCSLKWTMMLHGYIYLQTRLKKSSLILVYQVERVKSFRVCTKPSKKISQAQPHIRVIVFYLVKT